MVPSRVSRRSCLDVFPNQCTASMRTTMSTRIFQVHFLILRKRRVALRSLIECFLPDGTYCLKMLSGLHTEARKCSGRSLISLVYAPLDKLVVVMHYFMNYLSCLWAPHWWYLYQYPRSALSRLGPSCHVSGAT